MKRVIKANTESNYRLTDADKNWLDRQTENMCDQVYENYGDEMEFDIVMEHMEEVILDPEYLRDHEQSEGLIQLAESRSADLINYVQSRIEYHIPRYS